MIDTKPLYKLYDRLAMFTDDRVWMKVMQDNKMKREIIRLNTREQLYNKGVDSLGLPIGSGEYKPFTIAEKQRKGQRYDHITLNDTGAFYNSWVVVVHLDGLILDADDHSIYDEPLFDVYGEDVLGLTDESIAILFEQIKIGYINYIKNELLR